MKHGDIVTGETYAMRTGYGRPEAGDSTNVPVKVLDREKAWTKQFVPNVPETRDAYGRKMGTTKVLRYDDPAVTSRHADRYMLVQRLNRDTMEPEGEPTLALPRDLPATWERDQAYAALRKATREREREQARAARERREHVSRLLAESGVEVYREHATMMGTATWALNEAGALALVKTLAELRERVETLSESLAIAESNAVEG